MLFGFTPRVAGGVMRIDTKSIDGILDCTEPLEQNYVPPSSRAESYDSLSFSCCGKKEIESKTFSKIHKYRDQEMVHLLQASLAAAAAGPVSFALHIEPKESKSAKCAKQSDGPEYGAEPATPQRKHHCRDTKAS